MTTTLTDLLGEHLLQHGEPNQVPTAQLNGKTVGLYFSAHWCPPCRGFTPKLAESFKKLHDELHEKMDIVFISLDQDQSNFDEYYKEMPWKALPYSDRDRSSTLGKKFEVEGIPCLVILTPTCDVLSSDGVDEIRAVGDEPLRLWSQGKRLFWTRPANEGEHVWEGVSCTLCHMYPIVGVRCGCSHRQCHFNLCDVCITKNNHEHPLLEYIFPKMQYSLEQIFASVPYLLDPNNGEHIETTTLWKDGTKTFGIYFSDDSCPPERDIAFKLAEYCNEMEASENPFRLVLVSNDDDEADFDKYRSKLPWPAVPFNSDAALKLYYDYPGTAALLIVSVDGKLMTRRGRNYVASKGVEAVKMWAKGEAAPALTDDEFDWGYVSCDECKMFPLVGKRYYCSTCGNYDLCSVCEQKGHDHPLELIPQPEEKL